MIDDTARLRARLSSHRRAVDQALAMTAAHLDLHGGHVAWSGGKDSTVVAWLAHQVRPGTPIVTYLAGTEYPEVVPYCAQLAEREGWAWETIQTADVRDLLDRGVVPASDGEWWDAMIDGPARIAQQRHGPGLLWGLRADESHHRAVMLYATRGTRTRADGVTTCAPLWRWSTGDVFAALARADLPLCPTYQRMADIGMPAELRRVGRTIGRRGMESRMFWLRRGWPDLWATYRQRWPHLIP